MTPRLRYVLQLVVGLCLLTTTDLSVPHVLRAADSCTALREWASERYAGSHPTLDDLATHDRARRLAIVSVLHADVRAALWQEQLTRFSHRTDLSPTQRRLLAAGHEVFTPAFYAGDRESQIRVQRLSAEIEQLFPSTAHQYAWSQLGSVSPDGQIMLPPPTTNAQIPNCNCRTSGECFGQACLGVVCNHIQACGAGGGQTCWGKCG